MRDATGARTLDFLVIGVQKGGTTSLWRYLRSHPRIGVPLDKEAPFFASADAEDPTAIARFVASDFADAPEDALLGTVTPHYMMGNSRVPTERIAQRVATALPQVRIVALLRDPIERAISQHRMSVRRGWEARSFDEAASDLLDPTRAQEARDRPTETNAYLAQGEYGRILRAWRAHVPAERTLIALTERLEAAPDEVVDAVLAFLGLPPGHRPDDLGERYHRSGARPRVDREAERELTAFLAETIWPALPRGHAGPRAFGFFFETWNVLPDDERTVVSPAIRARLEEHYRADAELLAELGVAAPWLERWRTRAPDAATTAPAAASADAELRRAATEAHERALLLREELAEAHDRLTRAEVAKDELAHVLADAEHQLGIAREQLDGERAEVTRRGEEIVRLRTRLDRILGSPPFRAWARLQRLPGVREIQRRRTAGYDAEVERRAGADAGGSATRPDC